MSTPQQQQNTEVNRVASAVELGVAATRPTVSQSQDSTNLTVTSGNEVFAVTVTRKGAMGRIATKKPSERPEGDREGETLGNIDFTNVDNKKFAEEFKTEIAKIKKSLDQDSKLMKSIISYSKDLPNKTTTGISEEIGKTILLIKPLMEEEPPSWSSNKKAVFKYLKKLFFDQEYEKFIAATDEFYDLTNDVNTIVKVDDIQNAVRKMLSTLFQKEAELNKKITPNANGGGAKHKKTKRRTKRMRKSMRKTKRRHKSKKRRKTKRRRRKR